MKNVTSIEANAIMLLEELETEVRNGTKLSTSTILAMHYLKSAIKDADDKLGYDLENLRRTIKRSTDIN